MMRAIRVAEFGDPEVMRVEEIAVPSAGAGQVVVRLHAAGVNPVDTYVRSGIHARKPPLPYTPGLDGAGIVHAVGDGVGHVQTGDRVYVAGSLSGTYAEYAQCTAPQVQLLPAQVSFAQGAAIGIPYVTAWRAIHQRAVARAGETLLVHGASGGTGLAAVQIARAAGLTVFGTAGTERGLELVRQQGATQAFNHAAPGYLDKIRTATEGRGVDIILEMLANVNAVADFSVIAMRGRIVVIGNRGAIELNLRDAMMREADIRAMLIFNATPEEIAAAHAGIADGLARGTLAPVVGRELPLGEAPEAHRAVMAPGAYGKIALTM
jgi:NADPH2:quinone reductase